MTTASIDLRYATAADGARLQYEVLGEGEPVVFLHGGWTSRACWPRQREALAPFFRLILRDLRGHDGAPSVAPEGFGFDTTEMTDMLAVLDAERIDRAHLVVHSTGGALAFLFALNHPERVRRMVLIEPTLISLVPPAAMESINALNASARAAFDRGGAAAVIDIAMTELLGPGWQSRMSPRARERVEAQAAIAVAHGRAFEAMTVGDDELRALDVPALLLYGEHSMDWEPLVSERIGAVRPDLERRVIAGANHNVHIDQPDAVNAAIREFLRREADDT